MRLERIVTKLLEEFSEERKRWEAERASLLDRIQHPEVRQVRPASESVEYEIPKDEAELAQVGQVVPEFVNVGETGA